MMLVLLPELLFGSVFFFMDCLSYFGVCYVNVGLVIKKSISIATFSYVLYELFFLNEFFKS